jgi:hypothetical protein
MLALLTSLAPISHSYPIDTINVIPSEAGNLLFASVRPALAVLPDWAALGACFALAAAVFLFIFYIQPDASDLAPHRTKLDQLLERRDSIYDNLRDLKFEHRAGKYSEGDYELMKTSLENEAAAVLAEIEQVTESQVRRPRPVQPPATERGAR